MTDQPASRGKKKKAAPAAILLGPEKPVGRWQADLPSHRSTMPLFTDDKEVARWEIWFKAQHVVESQKTIMLFCMALLAVMFAAWLAVMFLWALGLTCRVTAGFLEWWLTAISAGVVGTAFSSIAKGIFSPSNPPKSSTKSSTLH